MVSATYSGTASRRSRDPDAFRRGALLADLAGLAHGRPRPPGPPHTGRGEGDRGGRGRAAASSVLTVVLAIVVAIVFRTFVIQTYWIPSESMLPTLLKDDRVAVTRLGDYTHPARGDVIVFSKPAGLEDAENTIDFLIKRVVGLPGDSMAFVNGRVYVNGQPLAEPYLAPGTMTENIPGQPQCTQAAPCLVPPDHVFAMGDNRTNSEDSRYRVVGPIPERTIVGRAVARVWPISRLSGL